MKRKVMWIITALMLWSNVVSAQKANDLVYLTADEVPNAVYWLPAPPAPGSAQFMNDISQYYWGKQQRLRTFNRTCGFFFRH